MKYFLSILTLCLVIGVHAQTTTKLTATKANDFGLVYTLPVTVVDVVIETEYVTREPGEFSNYAKRYLGITDAVRQPSTEATVKSITLVPRGVADPSNRWLMQMKGGASPYVILSEAGVPLTINTDELPAVKESELPIPVAAAPSPLEGDAARQSVTREMSQSSSMAKRAELAAQRIFELREYRSDLLSGQADNTPPDGKAWEIVTNNLSAQEAALTAMFAGTEKRETRVNTVTFTPDSAEVESMVIARLSPVDGLVDSSNLTGEPIYLTLKVDSRGELPLDEKGLPRTMPKGGVAYCIPGRATIEVTYDGRTLASQSIDLSQLGVVYGLDPKIFTDRKAPAFVQFDSTTGAIREMGTVQKTSTSE